MAASASDYFQKVGNPGTATTLSAPGYTAGGTSINVGSTTNFSTSTGVIFAIDEVTTVGGEQVRTAGTYNVYRGVVSTGTSITGLVWVAGDGDRNYSAGASTRVYITTSSAWANRLVDGILVHSDQDGTLKDGAVDNAAVLASNVVTTAKILDSNVTTAKIADDAVTPAKWTNPYCFKAYNTVATTMTDGANVKITLGGEEYDYNNNFDTTTSTYTIPVNGVYQFSAAWQSSTLTTGVIANAKIYKNGSYVLIGDAAAPPASGAAANVSGDILCTAGDTIEFYGLQDSAGNEQTVTGVTNTWMAGHLVHAT